MLPFSLNLGPLLFLPSVSLFTADLVKLMGEKDILYIKLLFFNFTLCAIYHY